MTDGPVSIAGILVFYCFFLTVESAEALKHSGQVLKVPHDYRKKVDPWTLRNTPASSTPPSVTKKCRRGWKMIRPPEGLDGDNHSGHNLATS
jgi:hypothetical protein